MLNKQTKTDSQIQQIKALKAFKVNKSDNGGNNTQESHKKKKSIHKKSIKSNIINDLLFEAEHIFKFMLIFFRLHKVDIISSFMMLCSISLSMQVLLFLFDTPNILLNLAFKATTIIGASLASISILRYVILNSVDREESSYFNGLKPLIFINITIAAITSTLLFLLYNTSLIINKFGVSPKTALLFGIIVSSFLGGIVWSRFGFIIAASVENNEEKLDAIYDRKLPFKLLIFTTTTLSKLISLSAIIALSTYLPLAFSIPITAFIFAFYHIIIFALMGVCYKIS